MINDAMFVSVPPICLLHWHAFKANLIDHSIHRLFITYMASMERHMVTLFGTPRHCTGTLSGISVRSKSHSGFVLVSRGSLCIVDMHHTTCRRWKHTVFRSHAELFELSCCFWRWFGPFLDKSLTRSIPENEVEAKTCNIQEQRLWK